MHPILEMIQFVQKNEGKIVDWNIQTFGAPIAEKQVFILEVKFELTKEAMERGNPISESTTRELPGVPTGRPSGSIDDGAEG